MTQINLAPDAQYIARVRQRKHILYILSGIIVAALIIVWTILMIMAQSLSSKDDSLTEQIGHLDTEIAQSQDKIHRIDLFERRLTAVDQLLQSRFAWSPVLQQLETLLPAPTVLSSIKGEADGAISLSGNTPNIDLVSQTMASLTTSTFFKSGTITKVSRNQPSGEEVAPVTYSFSAGLSMVADNLQ